MLEAAIDILLRDIHRFTIESGNALTSGVKGFFPAGQYGFESILRTVINSSGLSYVLFGQDTHCFWHFSVATKFVELGGVMCVPRLSGRNFRFRRLVHGYGLVVCRVIRRGPDAANQSRS